VGSFGIDAEFDRTPRRQEREEVFVILAVFAAWREIALRRCPGLWNYSVFMYSTSAFRSSSVNT
jgi:hypothetical protein